MQKSVYYNIHYLYIIKLAKWFMLFMPIVALFYAENGLDAQAVLQLQAVYSVTIVALEIPSGYVADAWGRRNTLILGTTLGCIGYVIYSLSSGLMGFLIAEIALGFGQSLISGADSAVLYDSLLDLKQEKNYTKYEGRITALGNFAESAAALVGGILASYSIRLPYIGQSVVAFLGIPAALLIVNPLSHKQTKSISWKQILDVVHYTLFRNKDLRNNIILSSIIGTATLTMAWMAQFYFKELSLEKTVIGTLWMTLNLTVAFATWQAFRVEKWLGQLKTILLISIAIPIGYIITGLQISYFGIVMIFLFYIVRGIATPTLKNYVNRVTPSQTRATVLSVRSFFIRLLFAFIGPFLGFMTDHWSLKHALISAGIIFLVFANLGTYLLFRKNNLNPN